MTSVDLCCTTDMFPGWMLMNPNTLSHEKAMEAEGFYVIGMQARVGGRLLLVLCYSHRQVRKRMCFIICPFACSMPGQKTSKIPEPSTVNPNPKPQQPKPQTLTFKLCTLGPQP